MNLPPYPLTICRRIEFSQTDAAGLVHFTTYFTLMEAAEAELFRQLGIALLEVSQNTARGFPRVDCQCRFRKPLRFDELVTVELSLGDILPGRLQYSVRFLDESGELCARGTMTTAYAENGSDGSLRSLELAPAMRAALEAWKNQSPPAP